jgi:superfamily II DNA or RNA helicase
VLKGLRPPQIGALHATLGHWTVSDEAATIVMPTGTGKTETMLSLLIYKQLERLLVIVPTGALRDQVGGKFQTLGILRDAGVLKEGALYPVVGLLEHQLQNADDVDSVFLRCNVIVTTMSVIQGCAEEAQGRMAEVCSHLFIDEAHHIGAPTWEKFRRAFCQRPILQFTATPFRSDGRHVAGKIIFNYPLRKAQADGYFKPINFRSVLEFDPDRGDRRIAEIALDQLRRDLSSEPPLDHIVLARAKSIERATALYEIYRQHPEYNTVLIHSKLPKEEQREAIACLRDRRSRVVVCVDMFGEGFDLPELKIAALHDIHKSLGITLQFTGRFTRSKNERIGTATMVANTARVEVNDALRALYADDPDWGQLLRQLSEGATKKQEHRSQFYDAFNGPSDVPLQNIAPKMSMVVYSALRDDWMPEKLHETFKDTRLFREPAINQKDQVAAIVTIDHSEVSWGDIRDLRDVAYNLHLVHWNTAQKLLYIHCSDNHSDHAKLAHTVLGDQAELICHDKPYRSLYGMNRLSISTLGLKHAINRNVRFTMYSGSDIRQGISEANLHGKVTSNLFAYGFENGGRASAGCSFKGKIWAHRIADDIADWMEWAHGIGEKLLNDQIDVHAIMDTVLVPKEIQQRPPFVPLGIDWPEFFWVNDEEKIRLEVDGDLRYLWEVGLELLTQDDVSPLRFRVFTTLQSAEYEVRFVNNKVEYVLVVGTEVEVAAGKRRFALSEFFQQEPPIIRFANGSFLVYNGLIESKTMPPQFNLDKIEVWDWTGIDIKKESQEEQKRPDSIQYRVIQDLCQQDFDIVFDDDDPGESADLVTIKVDEDKLRIRLFHLKFSGSPNPGARVKDLYTVCGQAQNSVFWKNDPQRLLDHLMLREIKRLTSNKPSRFEKGNQATLNTICQQVRYLEADFEIIIVQPGIAKANISTDMLELLSVTELYMLETFNIPLRVIASP